MDAEVAMMTRIPAHCNFVGNWAYFRKRVCKHN